MKCLPLAVAAAVICGCSKATPPKPPVQRPAAFSELPVEMTVNQRSTTTIPGSKLRLTIDDITRRQVQASVADTEGLAVLAATSLKEGESAAFMLNDREYQLTLRKLENELVGDDFATFVISSGSAASSAAPGGAVSSSPASTHNRPAENERSKEKISEQEKVEQLLAAVENDEGATFIRNDDEHSPKEAADHLRTKWAAAGDEIETAEDFIDKLASKSSLTGEPYRIRRADGNVVLASDYLREKLNTIDKKRPGSN